MCPQLKITQQEQSEDCLNLNIWRPSEINGSESLPVYVFIHGGDFEYGAGSDTDINGDTVVAKRYHSIYRGVGAGKANLDIFKEFSIGASYNKTIQFGTKNSGVAALQQLQFRVANTPLILGVKQIIGQSSVTSGLGVVAEYDTRNNMFFPTNGYSVNAEYMVYDEKIGSDWNYQNLNINGEVYIPVAERWTLAFAGNYQNFNTQEHYLPPTVRPYVELRGIASYRYQGDEIATAQSQVTYAIDNRWTVSAFYGLGKATVEGSLSDDESVDAYGAGFRYQIVCRYGLHMGVDLAFSDVDSAFYITVGSGF
ncbi:carboxylesterase family protein [Vibrio splendidus]|uniref:carboxylesterase family protein n=2 Tax=Vibrio TaxID=662 RepID=UPI002159ADBB|nr:carboxylesterase family protein [Vibrio splendidus]